MNKIEKPQIPNYRISEDSYGVTTLHILGSINRFNAASLIRELRSLLKARHRPSWIVDLKKTPYLDDFGVLALTELREIILNKGGLFRIENAGEK